jgi:polyhydroxybutyrate depolymerase
MGRRVESIPIGMPLSWALVVLISMANLAVAKGNPSQSSPTETIVSGGIERVFLLHVPEEIRGPAPLVIYLHGYTSDWREAGEYAEYDSLARKEGFFLVAPQGL